MRLRVITELFAVYCNLNWKYRDMILIAQPYMGLLGTAPGAQGVTGALI